MKKLFLSIVLLCANATFAQIIFQDDFTSYEPATNLSGQGTWSNNTSNGGFGSCVGAVCSNAKVIASPLTYPGYGTSALAVELKPDVDGVGTVFAPVTMGSIYVSYMINIASAAASPNDFFRVCSGGSFNTTYRIFIKSMSASTFAVGISKGGTGNPIVYTTAAYNYGEDHLLVVRYSILVNSADDIVSLFVNPMAGAAEPATPSALTAVGTDQAAGIDRMGFRQNATNTPTGRAGLITVASTWEDILLNNRSFDKSSFFVGTAGAKSGQLTFTSNQDLGECNLAIYAMNGAMIESRKINIPGGASAAAIAPITAAGVYIVNITNSSNQRHSVKIIVN